MGGVELVHVQKRRMTPTYVVPKSHRLQISFVTSPNHYTAHCESPVGYTNAHYRYYVYIQAIRTA